MHRVLRLKLDWPGKDRWEQLRQVAAEVACYKNRVIDAAWCEANGYIPKQDESTAVQELEQMVAARNQIIRDAKALVNKDAERGDVLKVLGTKKPTGRLSPSREQRRFSGRLSGDVYATAEREARGAWAVAVKKGALGGWSGTPRFGATSIPIRRQGVQFTQSGTYARKDNPADLMPRYEMKVLLLKKGEGTPEDHRRVTLEVSKHSARDRYQGEKLREFATGETVIDKVVLVFSPERRRLAAHISYTRKVLVPAFGERVATIGPLDVKHDRLTVRVWHDGERVVEPRDYSRRLFHFRKMKTRYDKIARRYRYSIGRSKGSRRILRRKLADSFSAWARQANHRWSSELISWLVTQGVNRLDVLPISDRDWPAHELIEFLKYKGEAAGVHVEEVAIDESPAADEVTFNAAVAATKKEQARAGKVREAVRTLANDLER